MTNPTPDALERERLAAECKSALASLSTITRGNALAGNYIAELLDCLDRLVSIPAPESASPVATAYRIDEPKSATELGVENEKAKADRELYGIGFSVNGWHVPARLVAMWKKGGWPAEAAPASVPKGEPLTDRQIEIEAGGAA